MTVSYSIGESGIEGGKCPTRVCGGHNANTAGVTNNLQVSAATHSDPLVANITKAIERDASNSIV